MKALRVFSVLLVVLGVLTLVGSFVLTYMVENNETVVELESFLDIKLTPGDAEELISFVDMYLDEDDYGEMSSAITALRLYAATPVINIVGIAMAGVGLLGVIVSFLGGKPKTKKRSAPVQNTSDILDDWT